MNFWWRKWSNQSRKRKQLLHCGIFTLIISHKKYGSEKRTKVSLLLYMLFIGHGWSELELLVGVRRGASVFVWTISEIIWKLKIRDSKWRTLDCHLPRSVSFKLLEDKFLFIFVKWGPFSLEVIWRRRRTKKDCEMCFL